MEYRYLSNLPKVKQQKKYLWPMFGQIESNII